MECSKEEKLQWEDNCPPSPQSFLDIEEVQAPKKTRRRKKGLPKYVKYKELVERDLAKLTPRQLLMVLRQKGIETESIQAIDAETQQLFPGLLPTKRKTTPPFSIPLKKLPTARAIRRLKATRKILPPPLHTSTAIKQGSVEVEPRKQPIVFATYEEMVATMKKEMGVHTCALRSSLSSLLQKAKLLAEALEEHTHLDATHVLVSMSAHYFNLTKSRAGCCTTK
ncbi:hypothetical protein NEDG_01059 [Nematocida displodere]|uniref:Uncharacterized protein n=1 Tax=Nematocida displodere TaxID=1805483 RepID=A0A177EC01_9MICR|nr:hypothetical protein NEDG_01059 [Nematocida displodere]